MTSDSIEPDDVFLVLLADAMTEPGVSTEAWRLASNGLYRSELQEQLDKVDTEPFSFDVLYTDYADFMSTIEELHDEGVIPRFRRRSRMGLSEGGMERAETVQRSFTEEQERAIPTVDSRNGE